MIAVRLYKEGNGYGLPTSWPEEAKPDVKSLPDGFDLLLSEAEYAAHLEKHRSEYEAAVAASAPRTKYRVSKDTIISRVIEMGQLPAVMAALSSQPDEDRFIFDHSAWFWSDNEKLRGLCASLKIDADRLFAPDEYLQG